MSEEKVVLESHICHYIDPVTLKKLFAHALLIDIENNNDKVDIVKTLLGSSFEELAPGTNRYALVGPDQHCYKVALDRRGIVDNVTEFKRAAEFEAYTPRVYESNGIINVAERVTTLNREDFEANRDNILKICRDLAGRYIFEDIGFALKNYCNWGRRKDGSLCILDIGYMIPIAGNESAMECPVCGAKLRHNNTFTKFICSSDRCHTEFSFIDVYRRLDTTVDDEMFKEMNGFELPNFDKLNDRLYNSAIMRGGHIHYDASETGEDLEHYSFGQQAGGSVRFEDLQDILNDGG